MDHALGRCCLNRWTLTLKSQSLSTAWSACTAHDWACNFNVKVSDTHLWIPNKKPISSCIVFFLLFLVFTLSLMLCHLTHDVKYNYICEKWIRIWITTKWHHQPPPPPYNKSGQDPEKRILCLWLLFWHAISDTGQPGSATATLPLTDPSPLKHHSFMYWQIFTVWTERRLLLSHSLIGDCPYNPNQLACWLSPEMCL